MELVTRQSEADMIYAEKILCSWKDLLHNQAPQYLVDLCQSASSVAFRQHFRSASRGLLVVPRYRLSSYGRRAFSAAGPAI